MRGPVRTPRSRGPARRAVGIVTDGVGSADPTYNWLPSMRVQRFLSADFVSSGACTQLAVEPRRGLIPSQGLLGLCLTFVADPLDEGLACLKVVVKEFDTPVAVLLADETDGYPRFVIDQ